MKIRRVKGVMRADGYRAVMLKYCSDWTVDYVRDLPLDQIMWLEPLLGWEISVDCCRDEDGYEEHVNLTGIVLMNIHGSTGAVDESDDSFLFYLPPTVKSDQEIASEISVPAREKIREILINTEARRKTISALHEIGGSAHPNLRANFGSFFWKCKSHGIESEIELFDNGRVWILSKCSCKNLTNELNTALGLNAASATFSHLK